MMIEIRDVNKWMKVKTVKMVDAKACNQTAIYFEDGSGVLVETTYFGDNLHGVTWLLLDTSKPVHEQ